MRCGRVVYDKAKQYGVFCNSKVIFSVILFCIGKVEQIEVEYTIVASRKALLEHGEVA